ncbi:extracellular solute-binding protein [Aeromicrobium phragmitis]|uniref:Extracellular solute-binding protein n=1 Tax=Aeromicrobium phragmitis TaxID=2478914 RepID=A0A3L8PSJ9_9ACTN|nr:extracellular solute-binding protein [Aeromicrobium phragmitis]RLV57378.1 extracellular solute-binding protein [Aeromicrobium phragmitis]
MKSRTMGWAAGGLLVATMALSACGGGSDEATPDGSLEARAQSEGSVNWYTGLDPTTAQAVADAFQQETGVSVQVVRAASGELLQRYDGEKRAGKVVADVLSTPERGVYENGVNSGEFVALAGEEGLDSLEGWPQDALEFETAAHISINPAVIGFNTDQVGDPARLSSWEGLLDFDGPLAVPEWQASPFNLTVLNLWQQEYGDDFLQAVAQLDSSTYASGVTGAQALASGEQAVLAPTAVGFLKPLMDQGAPIDYVIPDVTTGSVVYSAIVADAPHPSAARLFMNFLMSVDGQTLINSAGGASVLPEVTGDLELGDGYLVIDQSESVAKREELVAQVTR